MPMMNPWEVAALEYQFHKEEDTAASPFAVGTALGCNTTDTVHDPVIYPGIYAPSGFDMMSILIRVMSRPNPVVNLGPIDASCAIIMCDLQQPDCPVVYVNDPCLELTGYTQAEILGRNCRFMQAPGGRVRRASTRKYVDRELVKTMKRAVDSNNELAVEVTNFKKNGQKFVNVLSMIPIYWDSAKPRYSVGFMAEKTW
ncbi:putative vivid protein [Biscogniauxia marginata]|nr:putative vivid protein [Biscogniauxia marginata]